MANEEIGENANVTFGGTVYACLADVSVAGAADIIKSKCSTDGTGAATTLKAGGAEDWVVSATIIIPANASTIPNALDLGTTGATKAYPVGDESGQLEYDFTSAEVINHEVTSSTTDFMALAVVLECTGSPTIGTKV